MQENRPKQYIVGYVGRLMVKSEPPRLCPLPGEKAPRYTWRAALIFFRGKRGFIEEFKALDDGAHCYARHMHEGAANAVERVDNEIVRLEEILRDKRQERQDILEAAAQSGERVRVSEVTPHQEKTS